MNMTNHEAIKIIDEATILDGDISQVYRNTAEVREALRLLGVGLPQLGETEQPHIQHDLEDATWFYCDLSELLDE